MGNQSNLSVLIYTVMSISQVVYICLFGLHSANAVSPVTFQANCNSTIPGGCVTPDKALAVNPMKVASDLNGGSSKDHNAQSNDKFTN